MSDVTEEQVANLATVLLIADHTFHHGVEYDPTVGYDPDDMPGDVFVHTARKLLADGWRREVER